MKPSRRQLLAAIFAAPIVGRAVVSAAARSVPFATGGVVKGGIPAWIMPKYACFHFEVGKPTRVVYFDAQHRPVSLPHILLARVRFVQP